MNRLSSISLVILIAGLCVGSLAAEQAPKLGENAALRYWSAFAEMQDSAIVNDQVKELSAVLDGTASYDDSKYKDLIEGNTQALKTMARGTSLSKCDWGLDYALGPDTPMDYAPKATALARLNVLYVFHLLNVGDKEGAVNTLIAGLRFSRDIANGGPLMATLLAKDSLSKHLGAMAVVLRSEGISPAQRTMLRHSLDQLGPQPLDWNSPIRLEVEVLTKLPLAAWPAARVARAYMAALEDPSMLRELHQLIASLPQPLPVVIPNPTKVLGEKQSLADKLRQTRSMLQ